MKRAIRSAMCAVVLVACCQLVAEAQPKHIHKNTPWSKIRTGMTGPQVCKLLGNFDYESGYGNTWSQTWHCTDRCQGFDQSLYFYVTYKLTNGRWGAVSKRVSWCSAKWKGSSLYDNYDVSDEWP